jgi:hypothetical protein
MTGSNAAPGQPEREPLEAAEADLARVRELLTAAGRQEADAADVKESVQEYLETHGPAIRQAAVSVGEEVRRQALTELYKWRAQLDAQLKASQGTSPGATTGGAAVPGPDGNMQSGPGHDVPPPGNT